MLFVMKVFCYPGNEFIVSSREPKDRRKIQYRDYKDLSIDKLVCPYSRNKWFSCDAVPSYEVLREK